MLYDVILVGQAYAYAYLPPLRSVSPLVVQSHVVSSNQVFCNVLHFTRNCLSQTAIFVQCFVSCVLVTDSSQFCAVASVVQYADSMSSGHCG